MRAVDRGPPDLDLLRREHAGYVDALTRVGITVEMLDSLESCPDGADGFPKIAAPVAAATCACLRSPRS